MAKSSRGNQNNLHLPADFGPEEFDLSDGTIRKVREVKKIAGEQVTLPNVANQDCHQNEDPNQHEEQEEVHDSAQAGNDETKNRLPVLEKKQKNFPLPKKEEEKKFKSEHCTLLELENKIKQVNPLGPHRLLANHEEIVAPKKLQEYRKQQIARKAKDHLRNKGENGLSGRENNVESVAQETNQAGRALPGLEQMQYLPTQTQSKLPNQRHTTKESDCGSLARQQKFVLTPTEFEDIQREIKEAERQLAQLMRDLKPQQKRKERIIRHTHALQMQQQHQEMHRPGQYVMPEGCAEGQTEDLSHLPSPPKEEATAHPGRATVRRRRQWNRNQPSSQPEGFHSMPPTGRSHSSDFNLHTNSSRPVVKIEANTVILNINDWSSFPKSIDTEI